MEEGGSTRLACRLSRLVVGKQNPLRLARAPATGDWAGSLRAVTKNVTMMSRSVRSMSRRLDDVTGSVPIEGGNVDSYEGHVETVTGSVEVEGGNDVSN